MDTGQRCKKSYTDQQQTQPYTKHYYNHSATDNLRASSISSHRCSQSINKRSSHHIFPSWRPSHRDSTCHVTHGGAGWTTTTYLVILLALVSVNTIS
ncbi:hypothetical protein BgiBS90_023737, partial [Biomphalaria glabrata]